MFVIKYRKIFYIFSGCIFALALFSLATRGLNLGMDFTGGSEVQFDYSINRPSVVNVRETLGTAGITDVTVRPIGTNSFIFESKEMDPKTVPAFYQKMFETLQAKSPEVTLTKGEPHVIGPSIGAELRSKAILAIIAVILGILFLIAYSFRNVSQELSSWKYGLAVVLCLVHDVMVPVGFVSLVQLPVDSLFVVAILAVLALSVNDTIVVFDRVRENSRLKKATETFGEVVGKSLKQTIVRSLNTSIANLLAISALYFLGPEATRPFALILGVGLVFGTYSSVFLASPFLVEIEKKQKRKAHRN
jgi:preprotein translocase SecF subunit